ncbi:carbon-nitrogen hydrolase family protein [Nakamurella antarctica]|nr:carbon-nitrogen hydrolase family protein [Nakamurella antarctica]
MLKIAVAQFEPDADPSTNLHTLIGMAKDAAGQGAQLLLAPEGSLVRFLDDPSAPTRCAEPLDGPFVAGLRRASADHDITIAAGTFTTDGSNGRVHNTLVVAQGGQLVGAYRKVHLYDAFAFVESDSVAPGDAAPPVVEIAGVAVGFATCYDLRFPELFRVLQAGGAQVLALASAWVAGPLKEEHWLTLLKARAIENTCYTIASDQVGAKSIGRSAAFDPMGLPLLDMGTVDGALAYVTVDPARVAGVREMLPAVSHIRFAVNPRPAEPTPGHPPLGSVAL